MPQKRPDVQVTVYLKAEVDDAVEAQMEAFNQTKAGTIELILMQAFGMIPDVEERVRAIKARR